MATHNTAGDDFEAEELSQVEARTGRQVITSYNAAGELIPVGSVRYRDYDGRAVRSLVLESELSRREHPLGSASSGFRTVSHAAVLEPFLAAGYRPRSVIHGRGGASMIAILGHPEFTFPDPIAWDHSLLPDPDDEIDPEYIRDHGLQASVRVRSDLRRGHGVSATAGYFRLVCTNGLIAKVLDLGHLSTNHRVFSQEQVQTFVDSVPMTPAALPASSSELIEEVLAFLRTPKEEIPSLPRMLRTPIAKITGELSTSGNEILRVNLEALARSQDAFTKLDLINAYTNLAVQGSSPWGIYGEADPMASALVDLVELAGVKKGIRTFEAT